MWFIKFWLRWFLSIFALVPASYTYWVLLTGHSALLHSLNEWVDWVIETAITAFKFDSNVIVWIDLLVSNEKVVFALIWITWMLVILMILDLIRQHLSKWL